MTVVTAVANGNGPALNSKRAFIVYGGVYTLRVAIGTIVFDKMPPPAQKRKFLSLQDKAAITAQVGGPSEKRSERRIAATSSELLTLYHLGHSWGAQKWCMCAKQNSYGYGLFRRRKSAAHIVLRTACTMPLSGKVLQ